MTSRSRPVLSVAADSPAVMPAHLLASGVALILLLGLLALFVAVVASILRSDLSLGAKILWVIFVFWVPVLAWFAWYLLGRPRNGTSGTVPADVG